MLRNEPIENTNSASCFGVASILVASDDSVSSYKSFNTVDDLETEKPAENRPTVRDLIDKHVYLQKLRNAKLNDFEVKKKSFLSVSKELNSSYRDCLNMKGDTKGVVNVKNFVKNHAHELYVPNLHVGESPEPLKVDQKVLKIDLQTTVPEVDATMNDLGRRFWDNVVSVVNVNNVYYQCLTQIMDTEICRSIEDVKAHVALALENGVESDLIGSELIACCKEHLKRHHIVLDSKLIDESTRNTHSDAKNQLDALRDELAENKRNLKVFENSVKILRKEKKDLLNILHSYNTENVNRVSLEKQLKAEQETNSKLREMISVVFRKKVPYLNSNKEKQIPMDVHVCKRTRNDIKYF